MRTGKAANKQNLNGRNNAQLQPDSEEGWEHMRITAKRGRC